MKIFGRRDRMLRIGINGQWESRGQLTNPGLPGNSHWNGVYARARARVLRKYIVTNEKRVRLHLLALINLNYWPTHAQHRLTGGINFPVTCDKTHHQTGGLVTWLGVAASLCYSYHECLVSIVPGILVGSLIDSCCNLNLQNSMERPDSHCKCCKGIPLQPNYMHILTARSAASAARHQWYHWLLMTCTWHHVNPKYFELGKQKKLNFMWRSARRYWLIAVSK